ncbi:MAG: hypothetical protein M1825_000870 [Sarcosagium campestre]|nr:MAG: hypothetical protein M1825_000870 [Sarcosagium campestre]
MATASTNIQRRRPARMTLSPRVGNPSPKSADNKKNPRRIDPGAFGGMNQRESRIEPRSQHRTAGESQRHSPRGQGKGRKPAADFKALKMQRTLSPVSYGHRSTVKRQLADVESFDQFDLLPAVQQSITTQVLKGMSDIKPTPIQRLAISSLLGSETGHRRSRSPRPVKPELADFLLAAETGSGKTLAYLLPTIDAIKRAEVEEAEVEAREEAAKVERRKSNPYEVDAPKISSEPHPTTGRPRAIILVPTSELVSQVGAVVKQFSHTVKFRSALISAAYSGKVVRNRLFSPAGIDILVSTPHLVASIAESDPNILSRVKHLVIDEADSLLDRSFAPTTSAILDRAAPSLRQLILCSATIPRSLDNFIRQRFPNIRRLATPNLHAIPRRVQLGVVDIDKEPYRGNRNLACADAIWTIGRMASDEAPGLAAKRLLVFVNERETAQEVADFLVSKGIDAHALSRDTPEQRQSEILAEFTTNTSSSSASATVVEPQSTPTSAGDRDRRDEPAVVNYTPANATTAISPQPTPSPAKRLLPNTKVLVATDLGSRGIDTLAVRHVILYDVPHTTIDFIHRLGRTGRMGKRGRGIVLVGKHDRKDVVREVREGMYKGQALI